MKPTLFLSCTLLSLLLFSCNKKNNITPVPKTDTTSDSGSTGSTTGTTNTGNTCNVTLADAENIEMFPSDNAWNEDISTAPVDPYSSQIIANISSSKLKADFGSGLYNNATIGIPFVVVCGSQPK